LADASNQVLTDSLFRTRLTHSSVPLAAAA
jgi:hypothetical protein